MIFFFPSIPRVGLPGQVLVQIQPNPTFTLHPMVPGGPGGGGSTPGSVPNLAMAAAAAAAATGPGYSSLESLPIFPTLVSSRSNASVLHALCGKYAAFVVCSCWSSWHHHCWRCRSYCCWWWQFYGKFHSSWCSSCVSP